MKRFLAALVLVLMFSTVAMGALDSATSSGLRDADAAIATRGGYITGVIILTNGAADATLVLYDDSASATGTVLFKMTVPAATITGGAVFSIPIRYGKGIYADITGAGAKYIVLFQSGY